MKSLYKHLLIIALVLVSTSSFSQFRPVVFGLRVAPNISWMNPDADYCESEGAEVGFSWGLISEFYFVENYALATGLNVMYTGGSLRYPAARTLSGDDSSTVGELTRNYNLQYLGIPLVFKMKTEVNEKLQAFGKIGFLTDFILKAKGKDTFEFTGGEMEDDHKITGDMVIIKESLIVGGGIEIELKGTSYLILELAFTNGLSDILKGTNQVYPDVEQRAKNSNVELGIGIIF